jgi:hypothetical protein
MVSHGLASAARTLSKSLEGLLNALLAVDLCAAGAFDCLLGELEAQGAREVVLKIHMQCRLENYLHLRIILYLS